MRKEDKGSENRAMKKKQIVLEGELLQIQKNQKKYAKYYSVKQSQLKNIVQSIKLNKSEGYYQYIYNNQHILQALKNQDKGTRRFKFLQKQLKKENQYIPYRKFQIKNKNQYYIIQVLKQVNQLQQNNLTNSKGKVNYVMVYEQNKIIGLLNQNKQELIDVNENTKQINIVQQKVAENKPKDKSNDQAEDKGQYIIQFVDKNGKKVRIQNNKGEQIRDIKDKAIILIDSKYKKVAFNSEKTNILEQLDINSIEVTVVTQKKQKQNQKQKQQQKEQQKLPQYTKQTGILISKSNFIKYVNCFEIKVEIQLVQRNINQKKEQPQEQLLFPLKNQSNILFANENQNQSQKFLSKPNASSSSMHSSQIQKNKKSKQPQYQYFLLIKFQKDKDNQLQNFIERKINCLKPATTVDDYTRKFYTNQKSYLEKHQFQYCYNQPESKRKKQIKQKYYALAFQGGGAKGLAYVGVYKALLQNPEIPIRSIIGSSAGGIFALAVSTGITPNQLLKTCYTMNQIPKNDRIIVTQNRKIRSKQVNDSIKQLLLKYGILGQKLYDYALSILDENVQKKLVEYFSSLSGTMGQIINISEMEQAKTGILMSIWQKITFQKNYPIQKTKFNYYGLLLKGALMKGQAIQNIAAQCLMKYFIRISYPFSQQQNKKIRQSLGSKKWKILSDALKRNEERYDNLIKMNISQVLKIKKENPQDSEGLDQQQLSDIFVAIANKSIIYLKDTVEQMKWKSSIAINTLVQTFDQYQDTKKFNFEHLAQISNVIIPNQQQLRNNQVPYTLVDYERQFGKQFLLRSNALKCNFQGLDQLTFEIFFGKMFPFFRNLQDKRNHLRNLCDIITETITYVLKQKNFDYDINNIEIKALKEKIQAHSQLKEIIKTITLEEYYEINDVELTCTSVDLDDKIMRFFNHKTTPHLPVCKSVQMTGSFPIGFKAQKWKPEWGKYYVHYHKIRRQVDLVNHQFTDGGMLANFPIKYLDNRYMRSKYFSLANDNCQFLGFGLDYIDGNNCFKNAQQQKNYRNDHHKANGAFRGLIDQLWSNFSLATTGWKLLRSQFSEQSVIDQSFQMITQELINKIPLLRFLIKFLFAYPNADRHLNLECFSGKILYEDQKSIQHMYQLEKELVLSKTKYNQEDHDQDEEEYYFKLYFEEQKQRGRTQKQIFNQWKQLSDQKIESTRLRIIQQNKTTQQRIKIQDDKKKRQKLLIQEYRNKIKDMYVFENQQLGFFKQYKGVLTYALDDNEKRFIYEAIYNPASIKLRRLINLKDYKVNSLAIRTQINECDQLKKRQNRIFNQQLIIRYRAIIKQQFYFDTNNINYADNQQHSQEEALFKQMLEECQQAKTKLNRKLKAKMIDVLRKKIKYQSQQKGKQSTVNYLYQRLILVNQNRLLGIEIQQLNDKKKQYQRKLKYLAVHKFNSLFDKKQFEQIEKLGSFKDYKQKYYSKFYLQQNLTNGNNLKNTAKKTIEKMKIFQLQEFMNIEGDSITEDLQKFTHYVYIFAQRLDIRSQRTKHTFSFSTESCLDGLTLQQIIRFWDSYFQNKLIDEQTIIKNYFEWQLSEKFINQTKEYPSKVIEIMKMISETRTQIVNDTKDRQIFKQIFQFISTAPQLKNNEHQSQQRTALKNQFLQYMLRIYKKHIFDTNPDGKNRLISQLLSKWNDENYQNFRIQRNFHIINRFERDRVANLLSKLIIRNYQAMEIQNLRSQENRDNFDQLVRNVLVNNSSAYYFKLKNKPNPSQEQASILEYVQKFYKNCSLSIRYFYANFYRTEDQKYINLQQWIKNIIRIQSYDYLNNVKNHAGLKNYLYGKIKLTNPQLKDSFLINHICIWDSLLQQELYLYSSNIQKKLFEENTKGDNRKLIKFINCSDDFKFLKRLLKQISILESQRILNEDPFSDIKTLVKHWKHVEIGKSHNRQTFLKSRKRIVQKCIRYHSWLKKVSLNSSKFKLDKTFQAHFVDLIKRLERFDNVKFEHQRINLTQQKRICESVIDEIYKFFQSYSQQSLTYIQMHIVHLESIGNHLCSSNKLISQEMTEQFLEKLATVQKYSDQKITYPLIQNLFFVSYKFLQSVEILSQQVLGSRLKYFQKIKNKKYQNPLMGIDQNILHQQKRFEINNNIFFMIKNQIQKDKQFKQPAKILQDLKSKKWQVIKPEDQRIIMHNVKRIHLVLQGVSSSHLFFPSYFKLLEENRIKYTTWQNQIYKEKGYNKQFKDPYYPLIRHNFDCALQISAVTCSNFHSIFGFLIATGMESEDIRKQMSQLQSIAKVFQNYIQPSFNSFDWTKISQAQMKMCFQQIWKDQYNAFQDLEKHHHEDINVIAQAKQLKSRYLSDKQKIMSFCQRSFDDLIENASQTISNQVYHQRKIKLSQQLGLDYICDTKQSKIHLFSLQTQQTTKMVNTIVQSLYKRYESLIQYLIISQTFMKQNLIVTEQNKQKIWKGMIIKRLLATYKLKDYIFQQLRKAKMSSNITLSEFYKRSKVTILLTFTTINNTTKRLEFMNKNTLPNMPVWAAIVASTSLTFLYRQFQARKQWTKSFGSSSLYTKIVNDFFEIDYQPDKTNDVIRYSSGNLISSMPLELLTNDTVLKKMFKIQIKEQIQKVKLNSTQTISITKDKKAKDIAKQNEQPDKSNKKQGQTQNFIYIALLFKNMNRSSLVKYYKLQKNFFSLSSTLGTLASIATSKSFQKIKAIKNYIPLVGKACTQNHHDNNLYDRSVLSLFFGKIADFLGYGNTGKSLNTFTESNDNLIMSLYEDKILKCPIKINTLNFHEITLTNKNTTKLDIPSQKSLETIERSYHITKQFVKSKDQLSPDTYIYFRIQLFKEKIQHQQIQNYNQLNQILETKCKISFLSLSKWNRKRLLIIQYLFANILNEKVAKRIQNQEIIWTFKTPQIYLRFNYPQIQTTNRSYVVMNQFKLSFQNLLETFQQLTNLQNPSLSFDYKFNYTQIKNKYNCSVYPQRKNRQQLNLNLEEGKIELISNLQKTYHVPLLPGYKYQLRKKIEQHTKITMEKYQESINGVTNQIVQMMAPRPNQQLNQQLNQQRNHRLRSVPISILCLKCTSKTQLLQQNVLSKRNCSNCGRKCAKIQCIADKDNPQCSQAYCLNCVKTYIVKSKQSYKDVRCLMCSFISVDQKDKNNSTKSFSILKAKKQIYNKTLDICQFCSQSKNALDFYYCEKCQLKVCTYCLMYSA